MTGKLATDDDVLKAAQALLTHDQPNVIEQRERGMSEAELLRMLADHREFPSWTPDGLEGAAEVLMALLADSIALPDSK